MDVQFVAKKVACQSLPLDTMTWQHATIAIASSHFAVKLNPPKKITSTVKWRWSFFASYADEGITLHNT